MKKAISLIVATIISWGISLVDGKDYHVSGRITTRTGLSVSGAMVRITASGREFRSISRADGNYSLNISGIFSEISGLLENGTPFPNPFSDQVHIPFIISRSGDVRFSVYSLSGKKIFETNFPSVEAGSFNIIWDGYIGNAEAPDGFYIYTLSFQGKTWSGKLIKTYGNRFNTGTTIEQVMPAFTGIPPLGIRVKVITEVVSEGYYPVRLTDITIRQDTVIDIDLSAKSALPFRTEDNHISMLTLTGYRKLVLKGINLGSSPPGTFPGEIAYAISPENYEKWIKMIGEAGFNAIRVYTLHPPVFYEKLANYNYRHPDRPLLLFQGVWLDEIENYSLYEEYDLMLRLPKFITDIKEVVNCLHGNDKIDFRPGRAYGDYLTDISEWTAGIITGREISPREIEITNLSHAGISSFNGSQFSIENASPSDVFLTRVLDISSEYERINYKVNRPVSISSWPTLDPLTHPTEIYTDEDKASTDISRINSENSPAGFFATYHAYPYYPNFISNQPEYQTYSDDNGANSYYGYLEALKAHYKEIPLVIGEFGVPSSWGSAHQSFSEMDHGGYSEQQQGEKNIRMIKNILDAGCAGGFMFAWMDEWFKETWIVRYMEAYGFDPGTGLIPTRQLWHNITSPEQNFGLLKFVQENIPPLTFYTLQNKSGEVRSIGSTHDNAFFYADITFDKYPVSGDTIMIAFDTYKKESGESILPNGEHILNRSEFLLISVMGEDTSGFFVTEGYDMKGLTPRFDLTDPGVQKFRSTVSDRGRWNLMSWINDGSEFTFQDIGLLPSENSEQFSESHRSAVAWSGNRLKIRIPWTMMYFYDPTQKLVVNGVLSLGGGSYRVIPEESDGIALSVCFRNNITSTDSRYNWQKWLVVPSTTVRGKKSLQVVEEGLLLIPDFYN